METADSNLSGAPVTVTVQLPADVARALGSELAEIGRRLLEEAAVEAYRSRTLSRGQIARMLQLDWEDTEELLARHQCDRHYDAEDLERDHKNLEKMLGK